MANWDQLPESGNVEDRRGFSPIAVGGGGIGLLGIVIYLVSAFIGGGPSTGDLTQVLNQLQQAQGVQQQTGDGSQFAGDDSYEKFTREVLGSTDMVWSEAFKQNGRVYTPPKLVLFRQATSSGCGTADTRVGPFYCPQDATIYLDETFFDELKARFNAKGGDVAEAYVIAHEVGHHVQNQLGVMDKAARAQQAGGPAANKISINVELQADCFAGVWAHAVQQQGVIAPGEIGQAMDAAAAVGDDRIQQATQGRVTPDSWTHGSSAQRQDWFNRGYTTGVPGKCNTFVAS